jgi:hypothetical protein
MSSTAAPLPTTQSKGFSTPLQLQRSSTFDEPFNPAKKQHTLKIEQYWHIAIRT